MPSQVKVCNARESGESWKLRRLFSLDGDFWLPESWSGDLLTVGAGGTWDDFQVQSPFLILDDTGSDPFLLHYSGDDSAGYSQGLATATTKYAAVSKLAGNPIITKPGSGNRTQIFGLSVVKDLSEADSAKRWKGLIVGFGADSNWRIFYVYAANRDGPFTWYDNGAGADNSFILGPSGSANYYQRGFSGPRLFWDASRGGFSMIVNAQAGTSGNKWSPCLAECPVGAGEPTSPTLYGSNPLVARHSGASTTLSAAVTTATRTLTVGSTTGFAEDDPVILDADTTTDNFVLSRVRKVVSGTSLELYHAVTGIASGATVRNYQHFGSIDCRSIEKVGSTWRMHCTIFAPYDDISGTVNAYCESSGIYEASSLTGTWTLNKWASPGAYFQTGALRSYENPALLTQPITRAVPASLVYSRPSMLQSLILR